MQTIAEIRRENLQKLIDDAGTVAELNERLGWPRTDPRLTRIRNANVRGDRGKPFQMGDAMAREIERAMHLEPGWMDNVHELVMADGVAEPRPAYGSQTPPNSGTDYRTIAYSLLAALESSDHKPTLRQFLKMVDAAQNSMPGGGKSTPH